MRVISAFVDKRNAKRYAIGDTIDPPLDAEQEARMKIAGCIDDGAEGDSNPSRETTDLSAKTKSELNALAQAKNIDISDCKNKQDVIDKLAGVKNP